MKRKTIVLTVLFVLSMLAAPFAAGAAPRYPSKEAALETIFTEIKRELGGVPLTGFRDIAKELDVEDDTLSYSGEFKKPVTLDEAALERARKHFATVIERAYGIESYDIELDDDSLDVTFEQSRTIVIVTVVDGVYAAREYVPYVSVTISLTAEEAGKADDNAGDKKEPGNPVAGYTTLEYDIDITLERKVIKLQLGQKSARVNGEATGLEVAPFVQGGRTLVPLRFLGEQIGATFRFDAEEKEVSFTRGTTTIKMRLGDKEARVYIKGAQPRTVTLEVPTKAVQGRTVVPLRFVSENLDAVVRWNPDDRSIIVRQ